MKILSEPADPGALPYWRAWRWIPGRTWIEIRELRPTGEPRWRYATPDEVQALMRVLTYQEHRSTNVLLRELLQLLRTHREANHGS